MNIENELRSVTGAFAVIFPEFEREVLFRSDSADGYASCVWTGCGSGGD
jgi:hypothetical protein